VSLKLLKRHNSDCPEKSFSYWRCQCPFHVEGWKKNGEYVRRQTLAGLLQLNEPICDIGEADKMLERYENGLPVVEAAAEEKTIEEAIELFLLDLANEVSEPTMKKYVLLLEELFQFAKSKGYGFLKQFTKDSILMFRTEWDKERKVESIPAFRTVLKRQDKERKVGERTPLSSHTKQKEWERLRNFFKFAHEFGWIDRNPTVGFKRFKHEGGLRKHFTEDEIEKVLCAADRAIDRAIGVQAEANALRLRTLVLLLPFSGLRIGDAVCLETSSLVNGRLKVRTQKTGSDVFIGLPPEVVAALDSIPLKSDKYWFWSGTSGRDGDYKKCQASETKHWQMRILGLFRDAGIELVAGSSAHRFRHTFAHEHLAKGGSMDDLSRLLGHSSSRVTDEYYDEWSEERQKKANEALRRTWDGNSILARERQRNQHQPVRRGWTKPNRTPARRPHPVRGQYVKTGGRKSSV
jgi:integrase/recombinase XerD